MCKEEMKRVDKQIENLEYEILRNRMKPMEDFIEKRAALTQHEKELSCIFANLSVTHSNLDALNHLIEKSKQTETKSSIIPSQPNNDRFLLTLLRYSMNQQDHLINLNSKLYNMLIPPQRENSDNQQFLQSMDALSSQVVQSMKILLEDIKSSTDKPAKSSSERVTKSRGDNNNDELLASTETHDEISEKSGNEDLTVTKSITGSLTFVDVFVDSPVISRTSSSVPNSHFKSPKSSNAMIEHFDFTATPPRSIPIKNRAILNSDGIIVGSVPVSPSSLAEDISTSSSVASTPTRQSQQSISTAKKQHQYQHQHQTDTPTISSKVTSPLTKEHKPKDKKCIVM